MAVMKKEEGGYFSAIDSRVIRRRMLTLPAIGLLAVLLDRPKTWQVRLSELTKTTFCPADELKTLLRELIEKGFAIERCDHYGVYYDIYAFPPETRSADGNEPRAPAAPGPEPDSRGMSDAQRARWMDVIRANFKPTRDYQSPYRD